MFSNLKQKLTKRSTMSDENTAPVEPKELTAEEQQAANDKAYAEAKALDDKDFSRKKGETVQAYNERVPVAIQPVQPMGTVDYLGREIK